MSLAAARVTPRRKHNEVPVPMAADAVVHQGGLVCFSATGYGVPGADTAGLVLAGVATESKDNTGGADGDLSVVVRRGQEFKLEASGLDQADVGQTGYISDDETITNAAGATNDVPAGTITQVDSDGVWVHLN